VLTIEKETAQNIKEPIKNIKEQNKIRHIYITKFCLKTFFIHIHIHIYTHTHTYIYIYIYIHIFFFF